MKATFKHKNKNSVRELIARMGKMPQIALGFPRGPATAAQYPDGTSVLDVAFWNNYGTHDKDGSVHIPARRFMDTGSKRAARELKGKMAQLLKQVVANKMTAQEAAEIIGVKAVAIMQKEIVQFSDPPNAPITISGGWMNKGGKSFYVKGKKSDNPLIDSGLMRQTVTFDIRDKRK